MCGPRAPRSAGRRGEPPARRPRRRHSTKAAVEGWRRLGHRRRPRTAAAPQSSTHDSLQPEDPRPLLRRRLGDEDDWLTCPLLGVLQIRPVHVDRRQDMVLVSTARCSHRVPVAAASRVPTTTSRHRSGSSRVSLFTSTRTAQTMPDARAPLRPPWPAAGAIGRPGPHRRERSGRRYDLVRSSSFERL